MNIPVRKYPIATTSKRCLASKHWGFIEFMTVFSTTYLLTNLEQINRPFSEFLSGQGLMCYLIYSFFIRTRSVVSKDNLILLIVIEHLRKQSILCFEICTRHTHAYMYVQSFVSFCVLVFVRAILSWCP